MLLSEARKIRADIVARTSRLAACNRSQRAARRISRDVMRALNNQREDVAHILHCGTAELALDYEIEPRYAKRLQYALFLISTPGDFITGDEQK